jgi:sugar/nucleoside kinase (ribokinase family)
MLARWILLDMSSPPGPGAPGPGQPGPGAPTAASPGTGPAGEAAICVLGEANLDVIVRLAGPVADETDTPARTTVGAGGQAANVAAWITALGGRARLIAALGSDAAGCLVAADLAARGVDVAGPASEGRSGVVVSLSERGHSRSMLTDPGAGARLGADALRDEWFDGCGWLHLPAYSLVREPIRGAALAAARRLPRLSVDLSSVAALREFGVERFRDLLARLRPALVFATEAESELVGSVPGSELVVKLGSRGVRAGGAVHAAHPARAVDATGAGDAFAAGYLLGGAGLGLAADAHAVATMGAMP